jgi:hypothetical protein
MSNYDPIETTITYDHNENMVIGWTNHDPTIRAWKKDFEEYITITARKINAQRTEFSAELRIPVELVNPSNKLKRKRIQFSEETKRKSAERLKAVRELKEKTLSVS